MEFVLRPIGEIHTLFIAKRDTPIQPSCSTVRGQVEVYPAYVDGLRDLGDFSHVILLYAFHRSYAEYALLVKPFLDDKEHGLFATCYPARPNPIGLSIVQLLSIHDHILEIDGVDMLDGTALLDIRPYIPDSDVRTGVALVGMRTAPGQTLSRHANRFD